MTSTQTLTPSKHKRLQADSEDPMHTSIPGMFATARAKQPVARPALANSEAGPLTPTPKPSASKVQAQDKSPNGLVLPETAAANDKLSFQDLILFYELSKRYGDPEFQGDFYRSDAENLEEVYEWMQNEKNAPTKEDLQELIDNLPQEARWKADEDNFVWKRPHRPKDWKAKLMQANKRPNGFDFVDTFQEPNQVLEYQDLVLYSELSKRFNDNSDTYKDDFFKRGTEDLSEVHEWMKTGKGRPTRDDLHTLLEKLPQEPTFDARDDGFVWKKPERPENWEALKAPLDAANAKIDALGSPRMKPRDPWDTQYMRNKPLPYPSSSRLPDPLPPRQLDPLPPRQLDPLPPRQLDPLPPRQYDSYAARLRSPTRFSAPRVFAAAVSCEGLDCQPCRVRAGIVAKPGSSQGNALSGPRCLWCETIFPQGVGSDAAKTHVRRHHRHELLQTYGLDQSKTCEVDGQNYLMLPLKMPAFILPQNVQAHPSTAQPARQQAHPQYTELFNTSDNEFDAGPSSQTGYRQARERQAGDLRGQPAVHQEFRSQAPAAGQNNRTQSNGPHRPNGWRRPGPYQQHLRIQPHHQKMIDDWKAAKQAARRGAVAARGAKAANPPMDVPQPMSEKARGKQRATSFGASLPSSQISPANPARSTKRKVSYVAPYVEEENGRVVQAAKRRRTLSGSKPSTSKEPLPSTTTPAQAEAMDKMVSVMQDFQQETRRQSQELAAKKIADKDAESQAVAKELNECAINARADFYEDLAKKARAGEVPEDGEYTAKDAPFFEKQAKQARAELQASKDAQGEPSRETEQLPSVEETNVEPDVQPDVAMEQDSQEQVQHEEEEEEVAFEAEEEVLSPAEDTGDEGYVPEADMYCSRCLRKAPKLDDKSKGRSNLGRDVEMKFHSDPYRSCRIRNGVGNAIDLPNRSGWIAAKSLPKPLNKIKNDFIEANPEYKTSIYPPRNTTTLWKFDPNNESNEKYWGLAWPPVPEVWTVTEPVVVTSPKVTALAVSEISVPASESGSDSTEEVSQESGDEIEVQSDGAGPPTRASRKRALVARKSEVDGTYRPGTDDGRDLEDVPSAEAVAEEIREAELTAASVPPTPGLPAAAVKKRKRLPEARNTNSPSSSEEEGPAGSQSPKKKKKVAAATCGGKDTNYRPKKNDDDDDIEAEPTAEEVAAEIQKPLSKKAHGSNGAFLVSRHLEQIQAVQSVETTDAQHATQHEEVSEVEERVEEEQPASPESEASQSDQQTAESWEGASVIGEGAQEVEEEEELEEEEDEEEPVEKEAPYKGLAGMFAWRNYSPAGP